MAKTKVESERDTTFAKGGSGHMFSEQQAEPQTPAHTGQEDAAGPGEKFAKGGSTKMFGFAGAQPAKAGITGAR